MIFSVTGAASLTSSIRSRMSPDDWCAPCLIPAEAEPRTPPGRLGDPLLDVYLEFVAGTLAPEHGACDVVRPEGLLHRGGQAGG
ncbi:MAG: hypothetical protein M3424_01965, partial [Actinomycetota bacterium]|nr:hypothetical protein [Actinomycetota bacterium]